MGQTELIQALENLGGSAFLQDLEKEYFKIFYPPEFYGESYVETKTKYYSHQTYKVLGRYIHCLKKTHTIKTEKVPKTDEEYELEKQQRYDKHGTGKGSKKHKIKITLLL